MINIQPQLTKEQIDHVLSLYSNGQFQNTIDAIKNLKENYLNVPLLFNLLGTYYKSFDSFDVSLKMF